MIKALIFDLDGTLFDSSEANIASYQQAFKAVGQTLNKDKYKENFGLRFKEMMAILLPGADEATLNRLKALKADFYQQQLGLVKKNDGLLALVQSKGTFKTALVTTASRVNVTNLLAHFSVPEDSFDCIITGEDVKLGKPDPECYISAINALGVEPAQCCVFEDTEVGLAAARAAGAMTVQVSL